MINTLTFENGTKTGEAMSDGIKIPNPSSYSVTLSDIDVDAQRTTTGEMVRHRVCHHIHSIACTWDWLSDAELDKLLAAMVNETFSLTFRDPLQKLVTGTTSTGYTTTTVYASGDKSTELVATQSDNRDYWKLSVTFVEIMGEAD